MRSLYCFYFIVILFITSCGGGESKPAEDTASKDTSKDAVQDLLKDGQTADMAADSYETVVISCKKDEDCTGVFGALGKCEKSVCNLLLNECEKAAIPDNTACDDSDPCTKNDVCKSGVCAGVALPECECKEDNDCKQLEDKDLCNGTLKCDKDKSKCVVDPDTVVTCDPTTEPCKINECDATTGQCQLRNKIDDTPCNDGNECTDDDKCKAGACKGVEKVCNDKNFCTDDDCDPKTGCKFTNNTLDCDDLDTCTINDKCKEGTCTGENNPQCKCKKNEDCKQYEDIYLCNGTLICKNNQCVVDENTVVKCNDNPPPCRKYECSEKTVKCELINLADDTKCDDSNKCAYDKVCLNGECKGKTLECKDENPCTDNKCEPENGCVFPNNSEKCDDANLCTENDVCMEGVCTGTTKPGCDCTKNEDCAGSENGDLCDGTLICLNNKCVVDITTIITCKQPVNSCRESYCEPATGNCIEKDALDGKQCDDKNKCTVDDYCSTGACKGKQKDCGDNNDCTDDSCNPDTGCINSNNVKECDDKNVCTVGDKCKEGNCTGTADPECKCQLDVNCEPFEDGNYCNGKLICIQKKCVIDPNSIVTCKQENPCIEVTCETSSGACIEKPLPDGTKCSDGDMCTVGDHCVNKVCKGDTIDCNDSNICTIDQCLKDKGCIYTYNNGVSCNDGTSCTENDKCLNGICKGSQISGCVCQVKSDCALFEDNNKCNGTLTCVQNQCVIDPKTVVKCDKSQDTKCKYTECDSADGICKKYNSSDGIDCNDNNICTSVDKCKEGECIGSVTVDCDDKNDCTKDLCDPFTGCYTVNITGSCKDNDKCTLNEYCQAGVCVSDQFEKCDDSDVCTYDYCDPLEGCKSINFEGVECCHNSGECNDNDACTEDTCVNNICQHKKIVSSQCCKTDCANKQCGSDGCGGVCGTCPAGNYCSDKFQCLSQCTPNCTSKECGNSGCGTSCGDCYTGETCSANGLCVSCTPNCTGKECGSDGCGGNCGKCDLFMNCSQEGKCVSACESCTAGINCPDLGFETGNLNGWIYENDVSVQKNVGATPAPQGFFMAAVGNGVFGEGVGHLKLSFCVPSSVKTIKFQWKFYSEEFTEWCGSKYQDYFHVKLYTKDMVIDMLDAQIDDLCPQSSMCSWCGSQYVGLVQSDVEFDQGDVWNTPWVTHEEDISNLTASGEPLTFAIFVGDMGDSIYDTLILIDNIQFL